ncbi:MAG: hypothetical protein CVU64_16950 [Deltaproteobacteria bacterium HGW-Deltaproteobacteria-21]|nr:MAG: hypothetical protein CVU64_16950 [Deltaproteobacteria bacterium HGW-Deltaproteobacteria-21]
MKGNGHAKCQVGSRIDEWHWNKRKIEYLREGDRGRIQHPGGEISTDDYRAKPFMCRDGVDYLQKKGLVEGLFKI